MKKNKLYTTILIAGSVLFAFSCDDNNEISAPEIRDLELGHGNTKTASVGSDIHIEADVVAEGRISTIKIEIHLEGEEHDHDHDHLLMDEDDHGWEFDSVYTEFEGLLNTTFHKHVDIPTTAEPGTYHFHFVVTDELGNQTEEEVEDFQITASEN